MIEREVEREVERDREPVLLVDTRCATLRRLGDGLHRVGHTVIEADSFFAAKHSLATHHPAVIVTNVRLGAFNGLHLVHLARAVRPDLCAIVIDSTADALLQDEADRVGATYLIEPVHAPALIRIIATVLGRDAKAQGV